jgi:uncharacterized protein (TIGR03083 family)
MELKEGLIYDLDTARNLTIELLQKMTEQREIYPGWNVHHFLAHLTGWDEATLTSLRAHAAGREPGTPAYRGIDVYNEQSVAERVTLSDAQVISEWKLTREQLKQTIRDLTPEKVGEPLVYPWGPTGSVEKLVRIMIEHEHEHAEEIRVKLGL